MRSVVVGGMAVLALACAPAAYADQTVVVPGTSFPAGGTYLTYFGCSDLYHADSGGPEVRVTRDAEAPVGRRVTTLTMASTGTASGPVSLVESVATATSTVSIDAPSGSPGVAYVWFVSAELEPGEVWAGRADLTSDAEGWQQVDATAATYTWQRLDAATGTVLEEPGDATVADFTATHGDGPGYLLTGFGCDGRGFGIDDVRVGAPGDVTTYDLEGWPVTTSITANQQQVTPGEELHIRGTSVDPWNRVMGTPMVLEARPEGAATFEPVADPVAAGDDGTAVTTVAPVVTTDYRWVFAETAYADTSRSPVVRVVVDQPATEEPATQPVPKVPGTGTPDVVKPPKQQPATAQESNDESVTDESATELPVPELPTPEEPTEDEATQGEPTEDQPAVE